MAPSHETISAPIGRLCEWDYCTSHRYDNPFDAIELDCIITSPTGEQWRIPAFWRGGGRWSVRFVPREEGHYRIETDCSDTTNPQLHASIRTLHVQHTASATLPERIGLDPTRNGFQRNGTPFFWLADTWWMGLSDRLHFPDDFASLTADRKQKGFSVIQLVIGLFPDMDHFDPRAKNEAGLVWEEDYTAINPAYFDTADKRIEYLVTQGLTPCIIGAWGYYILKMGKRKMQQHWRYIIARWGSLPVIWCAAGEAAMPYYLSTNGPEERDRQISLWTDITRYIRTTDPFNNLITIHPTDTSTTQVLDPSVLDFAMLQAGHQGYESISRALDMIRTHIRNFPSLPVVMAEMNYEGIMHDTHAEIQRLGFWSSILSGAAGFSYGANGVWQVNRTDAPFGPSPHGGTWGNMPWQEAMTQYGSMHLGKATQLLEGYPWYQMQPHPEWLSPQSDPHESRAIRIAGIPGSIRILYLYGPIHPWSQPRYRIVQIERGSAYEAFFWDPRTGVRIPISSVEADRNGTWEIPLLPTFDDWVLVMENHQKITPPSGGRRLWEKAKRGIKRFLPER
jgi:hypothetical protein